MVEESKELEVQEKLKDESHLEIINKEVKEIVQEENNEENNEEDNVVEENAETTSEEETTVKEVEISNKRLNETNEDSPNKRSRLSSSPGRMSSRLKKQVSGSKVSNEISSDNNVPKKKISPRNSQVLEEAEAVVTL